MIRIGRLTLPDGAFLAPMAGVSDMPFRLLCHEYGSAFAYTEMLSAKGLHYTGMIPPVKRILARAAQEGPVGAQLFGRDPDFMYSAVKFVLSLGFALVDINMGCPAPKIVSNGEGCALMREPLVAASVIEAAVKASRDFSIENREKQPAPITVKFRKGFEEENYIDFARMAEASGASAVTLHGRTRSQLYSGKADLDAIASVKAAIDIPVIGNGDVTSKAESLTMLLTGCDAVMIGRGSFGNPWVFRNILGDEAEPTPRERADTALRHANMLTAIIGERQSVKEMRKHASWYLKGLPGSSAMRQKINSAETISELDKILSESYEI